MVTVKNPPLAGACGSFEVGWIYGFEVLTTILTIYGFGLRGNSVEKSTRKHGFRTEKHGKARKMRQKTDAFAFGMRGSHVRVVSLRPFEAKALAEAMPEDEAAEAVEEAVEATDAE